MRQVVVLFICDKLSQMNGGAYTMKNLGKLSETETEVIKQIWELGNPVTVSQLMDVFNNKDWKTSTLSTILKRLIEKGFLKKTMKGRVNYYKTTLTVDEYKKHETKILLNRLYNGNVKNFIAAMVDDEGLNKNDIDELKNWFLNKAGEE